MTALLPYGTGICHYAFGYFSVFVFVFLFLFLTVSVQSFLFIFSCFFPLCFLFFFNLHFLALDFFHKVWTPFFKQQTVSTCLYSSFCKWTNCNQSNFIFFIVYRLTVGEKKKGKKRNQPWNLAHVLQCPIQMGVPFSHYSVYFHLTWV